MKSPLKNLDVICDRAEDADVKFCCGYGMDAATLESASDVYY